MVSTLVGGDGNMAFIFHIGDYHPNWRTLIFFRGVQTTSLDPCFDPSPELPGEEPHWIMIIMFLYWLLSWTKTSVKGNEWKLKQQKRKLNKTDMKVPRGGLSSVPVCQNFRMHLREEKIWTAHHGLTVEHLHDSNNFNFPRDNWEGLAAQTKIIHRVDALWRIGTLFF